MTETTEIPTSGHRVPPSERPTNGWRGGPRWRHAAALLGAGLAVAVLVGAVDIPDLEQPVADVSRSLGGWTYLVVGGLAFFETAAFVGLVVPGETAVVAAGVVAERGEVELVPVLAIVWLAAAAGDTASFLLGRGLGRPFLEVHGARLRLDAGRLARVERFYERHGGKAVIAGRFVGFARAVTPFLAGASRFPLRRFVTYSLVGALAWAALFTLAGYAFSDSIVGAGDAASRIALGAVLIITLLFVSGSGIRSGRGRRSRRGVEPQGAQAKDDAQHGACDDVE